MADRERAGGDYVAVIISAIIDQKGRVLQMKWNDGFHGSSPLSRLVPSKERRKEQAQETTEKMGNCC